MIFKCQNCQLVINKRVLCKAVNVSIQKGSCYYLTGENGIGKTVFTQAVLGINDSLKGECYRNQCKNRTCYIPDTPFFLDNDSVISVIKTLAFLYDSPLKNIERLGLLLGLDIDQIQSHKISTLSLGTQKKLMILPLFLNDNDLYIMDEIFIGLDAKTQQLVIQRINVLSENNKTLLIIEHNQEILATIKNNKKFKEIQCSKEKIEC